MARSDDKLARAAHIKRHTIGTSNEISLSVLDAARNRLDAGNELGKETPGKVRRSFSLPRAAKRSAVAEPARNRGRVQGIHGQGAIRRGSWTSRVGDHPGVRSSASTGLAVESFTGASGEVSRRKRLRRVAAVVSGALIVVAAVAVVGSAGAWWTARQQTQSEGADQLRAALGYLEQADEVLLSFDESYDQVFGDSVLASSVASDARGALSTVRADTEVARRISNLAQNPGAQQLRDGGAALQEAWSLTELSLDRLQENDDREVANQALSSLSKKQEMLDCAEVVQTAAAQASSSLESAVEGWNALVEADEDARGAAAALGDANEEQIRDSFERGSAAIARFTEAQTLFGQAAEAFPACSFDAVQAYISLRLQSLDEAQASNQSLLDGDTEAAQQHNDQYNQLDAQAVEDAASLPSSVESLVIQAFLDETAAARSSYEQARLQAASSDAFIRDYLGTSR